MSLRLNFLLSLFVLVLLAWTRPAHAAQSYDNCTGFITSLPAVISTQGTWCLKQDLTTAVTNGNAIAINANNVTLDCNDFKLGGLAGGLATMTNGVYAYSRLNATVRHCNLRGFAYGVYFSGAGSGGHLIEDNRFDSNTYIALHAEGDGTVVQRNRVFDTGGGTVMGTYATGIEVWGSVDVLDNIVSGVTAGVGSNSTAWGIYTYQNTDGRIAGNAVRRVLKDGTGIAYGIFSYSAGRLVMHDNDVVGDGVATSRAFYCPSSEGIVKDNVIAGYSTPIYNCSDAGGNYTSP